MSPEGLLMNSCGPSKTDFSFYGEEGVPQERAIALMATIFISRDGLSLPASKVPSKNTRCFQIHIL